MGTLYNVANYKNKIINLLLKDKNFRKLLNPSPSKCEDLDELDVLIGGEWVIDGVKYKEQGQIFDHDFVEDTISEEKTFVFVETDIPYVRYNTYVDFNLYVCIFTKKSLVRLTDCTSPTAKEVEEMGYFSSTYANRIDVLCDVVDNILNGTDELSGICSISPASRDYVTRYSPNHGYYGRCLRYNISNLNISGDTCGNN